MAVADMNSDGFADVITGNGPGIANEVRIFSGDSIEGTIGEITPLLLNSFFVPAGPLDDGLHGIYVAARGPL